jgi:S1-C subfamily serine protease
VEIQEGLEVISVTPEIQAEQNLKAGAGALITGMTASLSRTLGLNRGDVILQIHNTPIRTADDAASALRNLPGGAGVRIYFERNRAWYFKEFWTRR